MKSFIFEGLTLQTAGITFVKFIDDGGEAQVWQVREMGPLRRELAAKVITIPYDSRDSRESIKRREHFQQRQGKAWARFADKSRNVLPLYGVIDELVEDEDGISFLIIGFLMPFSPYGSLKKYIGTDIVKLDKSALRSFLRDIAEGLQAGHDIDQCHGDMKPENIVLFDENGKLIPKLMDFGNTLGPDNLTGGYLGSPEYMAPEMFQSKKASKSADVYALGVLFYEVISGRLPFNNEYTGQEERYAIYQKAHCEQTANFAAIRENFDDEMAELTAEMLNKHESRITISEVISRLTVQERRSIYTKERDAERGERLPFQINTYRWNPKTHKDLMNRLHYCFIRGGNPSTELSWLHNKLQDQGIHGYAIYRVLGGYDYVLRVWLKGDYHKRLDEVLDEFRKLYQGYVSRFSVKTSWLWWVRNPVVNLSSPAELPNLAEKRSLALEELAKCIDDDKNSEFVKLKLQGFVHSRLNDFPNKTIRCFVTLRSKNAIQEWQATDAGSRLVKKLNDIVNPARTQLSVYSGGTDFEYLLKFRLRDFFKLQGILDQLLSDAYSFIPGGGFISQTFVEVDPKGFLESDDGSIVHEVALYLAGRTSTKRVIA